MDFAFVTLLLVTDFSVLRSLWNLDNLWHKIM